VADLPKIIRNGRSPWWWYSWYTGGVRVRHPVPYELGMKVAEHSAEEALAALLGFFGKDEPPEEVRDLSWLMAETRRRVKREGLRDTTLKEYMISLTHLSCVLGSARRVDAIARSDVSRFQDYLLNSGVAPITVNKYCSTLRAAFERLVDDEILVRNPFRKFKRLRHITSGPQSLTREQFTALMEALKSEDERYSRLLRISAFLGIRRTEVMGLRRDGISLATGQVRASNNKRHGRPDRWVYFDLAIRDDLIWFLETQPGETPFLFCTPDWYSKWTKRLFRKLGLPESLHLHSLRHTWATFAVESGVDLWRVQQHLDHATILTTEGYTHPNANTGGPISILHKSN